MRRCVYEIMSNTHTHTHAAERENNWGEVQACRLSCYTQTLKKGHSDLLRNYADNRLLRELSDNTKHGRDNSASLLGLGRCRRQHPGISLTYCYSLPRATFKSTFTSTFAIKISLMLFIRGTGCWLWGINRHQLAISISINCACLVELLDMLHYLTNTFCTFVLH